MNSKNMTWLLVPVTVVGIIISLSILTESKSSIVEREFEEFKEFDEYEDNMDKDDFYEDDYDEEYYDENGEKYYLYRIIKSKECLIRFYNKHLKIVTCHYQIMMIQSVLLMRMRNMILIFHMMTMIPKDCLMMEKKESKTMKDY